MAWDDDKATGDEVTSDEWDNHVSDQKNHNTRHESGGVDEVSVDGLTGVLADPQPPNEEQVEDIVSGLLTAGDKLSWTYDDGNDTLTIDTTALDTEEVEDTVAALVTAGNAITVNYDDPNDTLTVGVNESALSFYDGTDLTADVDNQSVRTDVLNNISYFPAVRQDPASNEEFRTTSPATSYSSVSLSSLPSNASIAVLLIFSQGNGSNADHNIKVREAGSTRSEDARASGWAGHGSFDAVSTARIPVNSSNEIEYETKNSSEVIIRAGGYL